MGTIGKHIPVKLICGVTFIQEANLTDLYNELENLFSTVECKSDHFAFSPFTKYYEKEMGQALNKLFLVFKELQNPENLPKIKVSTNQIEDKFLVNNKRSINLDPGYISDAKLVLATTKNYSHRIYLGQGIFGDIHLQYTSGSYQPQPWTYPDYKQPGIIEFFNGVRERYFEQIGEEL